MKVFIKYILFSISLLFFLLGVIVLIPIVLLSIIPTLIMVAAVLLYCGGIEVCKLDHDPNGDFGFY